jgi:hypothetical protein
MLASETNGQHILSILNGRNITKKSITKSFRVDEDVIKKIENEAKNNNTSLNAEINKILRKYVDWDMLADKVGMLPITKPIVYEIFQNIMTKEQVIDLADKVAKNVIREAAHFMKGSLTLDSFLPWLKTRMEYCSKVNCMIEDNYNNINPQIKLMFKHDLGENWSIYHKIILDNIFYEMGTYTVGIEATPTTLQLCFN